MTAEAPTYAMSVLPSEILSQRERGWPDFHPEAFCHTCGHRNAPSWWVDSDLWNLVTEGLARGVLEILCPSCFANRYHAITGLLVSWRMALDATGAAEAEVVRLRAVAEAADEVWRCKRCNGGGMIAPGDCCQTCAGDGLRVEWDDDGSDLRPLVAALAALEASP